MYPVPTTMECINLARPVRNNYVDNKRFYAEMIKYKAACVKAEAENKPQPKASDYIGLCIYSIANKLSNKSNFRGYPHKEDMIGDGIENCIMYIGNFDPDKSTNPFAYFTQIIYFAFLRRIDKEKKALYTKYKEIERHNMQISAAGVDGEQIVYSEGAAENMAKFMEDYETKKELKK